MGVSLSLKYTQPRFFEIIVSTGFLKMSVFVTFCRTSILLRESNQSTIVFVSSPNIYSMGQWDGRCKGQTTKNCSETKSCVSLIFLEFCWKKVQKQGNIQNPTYSMKISQNACINRVWTILIKIIIFYTFCESFLKKVCNCSIVYIQGNFIVRTFRIPIFPTKNAKKNAKHTFLKQPKIVIPLPDREKNTFFQKKHRNSTTKNENEDEKNTFWL